MRAAKTAALLLLLTLFAGGAAAQTFEGDLRSLKVDHSITVNATVTNPLPVPDTMFIEFGGDAITSNSIVAISFPDPDCYDTGSTTSCKLSIGPATTEHVNVSVHGTAVGQATLTGVVNSSTTQLTDTDELQIRVQGRYAPITVSAPALTLLEVLAVFLGAALLTARNSRSKPF